MICQRPFPVQVECQSLKKTAGLNYEALKVQEYWSHLYPSQARLIFKWRSRTLDLKTHLTYKYSDTLCRSCKRSEETPDHVLNCGTVDKIDVKIDILGLDKVDEITELELKKMALRMSSFLEKVSEHEG